VVRAADAAGMDELWLWEHCFSDSRIASAAPRSGPRTRPRPSHESSAASGSSNGAPQADPLGARAKGSGRPAVKLASVGHVQYG
jgi:hypothetical protein